MYVSYHLNKNSKPNLALLSNIILEISLIGKGPASTPTCIERFNRYQSLHFPKVFFVFSFQRKFEENVELLSFAMGSESL